MARFLRTRTRMFATVLVGMLTLLAMTGSADAALRRLQVFQQIPYNIVKVYGITEWKMTSPPSALQIKVRCTSNAPTEVVIHGQTHLVQSGTTATFPSNKALGKRPRNTPILLRIAPERRRTKGVIKFLK